MQTIGKILIIFGAVLLSAGIIIIIFPKLNFFGKLPGDISYKGENFSFYFPIVTCIVISIVLTLIFWIFNYFIKK